MGFKEDVWAAVRRIPRGRVASYGDVASFLGTPLRARQVGNALGALSAAEAAVTPWQRVVNVRGFLSIRGAFAAKDRQRLLLLDEGVPVGEDYIVVDFDRRRWRFPYADGNE